MSENTETTTDNTPKLRFGFGIMVDYDGNVFVEKNTSILSIPVEREATLIEVRRYLSEILMDLQAQAAAEYSAMRIAAVAEEAKKEAAAKTS